MSPLHVAVIMYFDVSLLVTKCSSNQKFRKIHRKIRMLPESLLISLIHKAWVDLINGETATGGILEKSGILKNLANSTVKHLCWSMEL